MLSSARPAFGPKETALFFNPSRMSQENPQFPGGDRWFEENLLPHEPMLKAWLRSRFSSLRDIDDVVQESYLRVLRVEGIREMKSPKGFLFSTARNLAMDQVRRNKVIRFESLAEKEALFVLLEHEDFDKTRRREKELQTLTKAIHSLPPRCRQVFTLRKIYGLSHKEISEKLGISLNTIDSQISIGLWKCKKYFKRAFFEDFEDHE